MAELSENSGAAEAPEAEAEALAPPLPVTFRAADLYPLGGFLWRHEGDVEASRPVVLITAATSVRCRYYSRFAEFLFRNGFDVLTYDYRGIGESRAGSLRRLDACWLDWGHLDCEAALRYAAHHFPGRPIYVVAHSIGGFALGLAPSSHLVRRIFTMGAQYAYWRDYAREGRLSMLAKWNLVMPLLTLACGYFPGKSLGWLEDTPRGVVRDWVFSRPRFEDTWRGRARGRYPDNEVLLRPFAAVTAPILAISIADDPFGTVAAVERLLGYFSQSPRTHLRLAPADIGEREIGHFAFFHSRFERQLWNLPLAWLKDGRLPPDALGEIVAPRREGR